jgi:uncharacterized protein (DUF1330 family)
MAASTRHVLVIGLEIRDEASYRQYRAEMTPILKRHGGDFAYDFVVSQVLRQEAPGAVNRVFAVHFPDAETAGRFFGNEEYVAVRGKYFDPAVGNRIEIGAFDQPVPSGVLK